MKYKFNENLLKLSKNKNLELAKTEWREIYRENRTEKTGLCICQHRLKNIIYMYNIYTKYTITVGSDCCKKFNLQLVKLDNTILKNVIGQMLVRGEYEIINNILEYTNDIQNQLIKYIRNIYENEKILAKIQKLHSDIGILIKDYDLTYLQDIYDEINNFIINEMNAKERERIDLQEKQRIEHDENEKTCIAYEKEIELDEKLRIELERHLAYEKECIELQREKERIKNECLCGIIKTNICICVNPKYELVKLSNNIWCILCNKWKCRCRCNF